MNEIVTLSDVDLLNMEVEHKVWKAEKSGELREEHKIARQLIDRSNREKGAPIVYKRRNRALVYFFLFLSVYFALLSSPLMTSFLWGVFMFYYTDFYGGLLHYILDEPCNLTLPLIGEACLEFQWHHHIPKDIASQRFLLVIGALNVLAVVKWTTTYAMATFVCKDDENYYTPLMLTGWAYLFGVLGQWSHRQVHTPAPKRSPLAWFLQESGIILHPSQHAAHHNSALKDVHDDAFSRTYPILNGKSGSLLEICLSSIRWRYFWLVAWITLTLFDVFLFTVAWDSTTKIFGHLFND